jgi:hypothetical protein
MIMAASNLESTFGVLMYIRAAYNIYGIPADFYNWGRLLQNDMQFTEIPTRGKV